MAIFDTLIDDVAIQFGLGSNAGLIVGEILSAITGTPGGVGGFLKNLKTAGLSPEVASWLGHANAAPLAAAEVDRAFGSTAIGGIASRLGLAPTLVSSAVGYALPKVINLLTPGGVIPTSLPAEVTNFATPVTRPEAAPYSTVRRVATPYVAPTAQMAPRRVDVYHALEAHDEPAMTSWLWPLLGALAVLGLGLLFWPTGNRTVAPPVAQAPVVAPAPPAPALVPPRLEIANDGGVPRISGAVHDDATKTNILNALRAVFGIDKVQSDIAVDLNRAAAPWLVNFRNGIEALKIPGVRAVFDGNSVNLGGSIGEADLNRVTASIRSVLGVASAARALFTSLVFGLLGALIGAWLGTRHKRVLHPHEIQIAPPPLAVHEYNVHYDDADQVIVNHLRGLSFLASKQDLLRYARAGNSDPTFSIRSKALPTAASPAPTTFSRRRSWFIRARLSWVPIRASEGARQRARRANRSS